MSVHLSLWSYCLLYNYCTFKIFFSLKYSISFFPLPQDSEAVTVLYEWWNTSSQSLCCFSTTMGNKTQNNFQRDSPFKAVKGRRLSSSIDFSTSELSSQSFYITSWFQFYFYSIWWAQPSSNFSKYTDVFLMWCHLSSLYCILKPTTEYEKAKHLSICLILNT